MKARKVKGLKPDGALADNSARLVSTRLDELCDFAPAIFDPANVDELHDLRIAAKRLRYVLEATADVCFGPYAAVAARRARDLQDLIGEIHDCDVQRPRVARLAAELAGQDRAELQRRAGVSGGPAMPVADLPNAATWSGLAALDTYLRMRREQLYEDFLLMWHDLGRDGFRARLEFALKERPQR